MKSIKYMNTEETNTDFDLSKPTKEEYEASKREREYFSSCIRLSRKRQNELLDELCEERSAEKTYMEIYEKHKEVIRRYEIYEEIESSK